MTTMHISDAIQWFERNAIQDASAYDDALCVLKLQSNYYFTDNELEMILDMVSNYEASIAGDFE